MPNTPVADDGSDPDILIASLNPARPAGSSDINDLDGVVRYDDDCVSGNELRNEDGVPSFLVSMADTEEPIHSDKPTMENSLADKQATSGSDSNGNQSPGDAGHGGSVPSASYGHNPAARLPRIPATNDRSLEQPPGCMSPIRTGERYSLLVRGATCWRDG